MTTRAFEREFDSLLRATGLDLPHVKQHTRLLTRAIEWRVAQDNPSFLLFGDEIQIALQWLEEWDSLPADERPTSPQTNSTAPTSGKAIPLNWSVNAPLPNRTLA
jgi:hypothetical protein